MERNYHYSLRNNLEERCAQILSGENLKSRKIEMLNIGGSQSGFIEDSDLLRCDAERLG
jgi:hypothetical protein